MTDNSQANDVIRGALADVLLARLQELDLPTTSASFEEATRIGTTQAEALDLTLDVERALASGVGLPGGACLMSARVCGLFPAAWEEAVRRSGVVPALVAWEDNGATGSDCTFLFGYLPAARAAAARED